MQNIQINELIGCGLNNIRNNINIIMLEMVGSTNIMTQFVNSDNMH